MYKIPQAWDIASWVTCQCYSCQEWKDGTKRLPWWSTGREVQLESILSYKCKNKAERHFEISGMLLEPTLSIYMLNMSKTVDISIRMELSNHHDIYPQAHLYWAQENSSRTVTAFNKGLIKEQVERFKHLHNSDHRVFPPYISARLICVFVIQ